MSSKDLQLTLTGRDVSGADSLRQLARAANQAAKSVTGSFDEMNRQVRSSSRESSESVTQEFGSRLASWGRATLAGVLGGIAASVTSTVTGVVADAGQAVMSGLKSSVIDYNALLENANIGFTTMLGSGKAATKFLDQLQDFAQKTPFDTGNLVQLAQQMMGYGVAAKNVIPYLTALGDAAASAGRVDALPNAVLAFEQMSARGRVDLSDMNQLTAAGVPALKILAGAYGTTTGGILKMIHSGNLMSSQALPALIGGIEHGTKSTAALGGMMNKQSDTLVGAMSNIHDSVTRVMSTAFLPFFKVIERGALQLLKFTQSTGLRQWAQDTSRNVGAFLSQIGQTFDRIFKDPSVQAAIGRLGSSLSAAFSAIGPALAKILPNLASFAKDALPAVIDGITDLVNDIPTLLHWWGQLSAGLKAIGPYVADAIRLITGIGQAVFGVATVIQENVVNWVKPFIDFTAGATQVLTGFNSTLVGLGGDLVTSIVNGILGQGNPIASALSGLVGSAVSAVQSAMNGLAGAVSTARSVAGESQNDLRGAKTASNLARTAAQLKTVQSTRAAVPSIPAMLTGGGGGGGGSAASQRKSLADITAVFRIYGAQVAKGVKDGLLGNLSDVVDAGKKMRDAIQQAFDSDYISKTTETNLLNRVASMTDRLKTLAKERSKVLDQLATLKTDRSQLISSTRSASSDAAGIMNFGLPGDAIQNLQAMLLNTTRFKTDLQQLAKSGVGQAVFGQLVAGWQDNPAAALSMADQLLAHPLDLQQIVGLQKQLSGAASGLATFAGNTEYGSAIAAKDGKAKVLGWEMQKTARGGLAASERELHLHLHLSGVFAGTEVSLAKTMKQVMADAVKKGQIPKNWATA